MSTGGAHPPRGCGTRRRAILLRRAGAADGGAHDGESEAGSHDAAERHAARAAYAHPALGAACLAGPPRAAQ
eukprot:1900555-Rhodomonas_salina.1